MKHRYCRIYLTFLRVKKQEDIRRVGEKFWEKAQPAYGTNSQAVVVIAGNRANMGTIDNANHELEQTLGYKKVELIGENISIIMPEIIGKYHNLFMQKYFEKNVQINVEDNKERLVFSQHIKGYIVPSLLFARVIPNLENGVQFLGFLKQANNNLEEIQGGDKQLANDEILILLLNPMYDIIGFNLNTAKLCSKEEDTMNIHKYLENDRKINLKKIYPKIFEESNNELVRSSSGVLLPLNLANLKDTLSNDIIDTYTEKKAL